MKKIPRRKTPFTSSKKPKSTESLSQNETINPPDDGPEYARKKYVPPCFVGHGIWIGPLGSCRTDLCAERGITHIVNCAREVRLFGWVDFEHLQNKGIAVEQLNWLDNETQQIFPNADLNRAIKFIDQGLRNGGQVLINCSRGVSRSASVVCAYLIIRQGYSASDAMAACKKARPVTDPNPSFKQQLFRIEACVKAKEEMERNGSLIQNDALTVQVPVPVAPMRKKTVELFV